MSQLDQGIGEFTDVNGGTFMAQHGNALIRTDIRDFHWFFLPQIYGCV
jgi:hypothetical protein